MKVDFGVSSLNAKKAKTFVGTPYWMAPEVIDSKSGMTSYNEKVDIWSIGITCIELAETMPPLSYINPMRALFQIPAREPPTLEKKEKWSAEFHDFIATCLEKNPKKRLGATELLQVLLSSLYFLLYYPPPPPPPLPFFFFFFFFRFFKILIRLFFKCFFFCKKHPFLKNCDKNPKVLRKGCFLQKKKHLKKRR